MSSVNTNVAALVAQNVLSKSSKDMDKAMEQISTGKRFNSASGDPSGLMIATTLKSSSLLNRQASQNANEAISMLQTLQNGGRLIIDVLLEMKQIAHSAATSTFNQPQRIFDLDTRFNILGKTWAKLSADTQWANASTSSLDVYNAAFRVRLDDSANPMAMTLKSWNPTNSVDGNNATGATVGLNDDNNLRIDRAWGFDRVLQDLRTPPRANFKSHSHVQSMTAATNAVAKLDATIANATVELSLYGSYITRLELAADNARGAATEKDKAHSKIVNTNYAEATAELSRTQILTQAATAILAQANQESQMVLQLLQ
jgi:flagellin